MLAEGPLGRFNSSVALMKALGALQEAMERIEALEAVSVSILITPGWM